MWSGVKKVVNPILKGLFKLPQNSRIQEKLNALEK